MRISDDRDKVRGRKEDTDTMKLWKKCPLLVLIVVSGLLLEMIGLANRNGVYADYRPDGPETPAMAAVFTAAKDGVFPWSNLSGEKEDEEGIPNDGADDSGLEMQPGDGDKEEGAADGGGQDGAGVSGNDAAVSGNDGVSDISGNTAGQEPAEEEQETYSFVQVDESYFDDAAFIGDSRTQGLLEYGGIEDRAAFYCRTSLTVYNLFEKPKAFIQEGDEKITLEEALTRHSYKKIYLMIGINEMGTGTPESFFEAYARAVYKIRQLQPDAIIFLQGIMRVAGDKNASDPIFNNTNINIRNVMIETLANGRDIFYIDVNEAVCDENGNLYADWTFDQIHLKAKYYQVWKDYLLQHGIMK